LGEKQLPRTYLICRLPAIPALGHDWDLLLLFAFRANAKVMVFALLISGLAAANALLMPLLLEKTVTQHAATAAIKLAGRIQMYNWLVCGTTMGWWLGMGW
jgi:hypothetical protein